MVITYKDNRKCQNCSTPISDQTHALRKSCPRKRMPDGSVLSCKDDFHSAKNKKENRSYRKLIAHHKSMDKKIYYLLRNIGETVILEDINRYGIILKRPIELSKNENGGFIYTYMQYSIIQLNNKQYKITKHDPVY